MDEMRDGVREVRGMVVMDREGGRGGGRGRGRRCCSQEEQIPHSSD